MNIAEWLRTLGLEQYEATFHENDVNTAMLPTLTAEDLKEIGIASFGHRRRLLEAIAELRPKETQGDDAVRLSINAAEGVGTSETTAERRPLSVMFCDLVGSTALASRLDPEDLRDVIRAYQACVAATIQPFDGFIARYVGDGVLVYFGWPEAGETDAQQAVRAGLAVAAAVSAAPVCGEPLSVRVGIATGLVVIGEPIGSGDSRQQTAVGDTPNLAARLQGLAAPNQVVIDAATRRQIGGLFTCDNLGTVELKGLPLAVPAWQVVSENRALGQFEGLRSGATPLVGRAEEIGLLLRRWTQAKTGNGRAILISGEPGVGKSRLAEVLAERIADEPHIRLRYFCSPHHQDSALYPIVAQMDRAAGFAPNDASEIRVAKLQALLAATEPPTEDVALIAELHDLQTTDFAPSLDLTPQRRKDKTFQALLRHLEGLARQQPVLVVFDDVHWIDPSSLDLLNRLIEQMTTWPVLLVALFRPEFQPPWLGQPQATLLNLARLDQQGTAAMVSNVAGDAALPAEIVAEIVERTDGVPLFVEELTKALLEAGAQAPATLSAMPHPTLSIPPTLHASLMARLDRLGSTAREVAQAGAAIGREFTYALLAATTDLPEPELHEALEGLSVAGLLYVRGAPPETSYLFKHALVQDAAYGSLLRGRRQNLHRRIAGALEEHFPEIVAAQPVLLARHCQEAGLAEQAVLNWLKAGQQALARSAMAEAVSQLRKGLDVLAGLPDNQWRQQQGLDLQAAFGSALASAKGHGAAEVGEALARASVLAEQLDQPERWSSLIVGQWAFHFVRSEPGQALRLAEQLEKIGEARNDVATRLQGHRVHGLTRCYLGQFVAARALLEGCQGLSDPIHRTIRGGQSYEPYATMLGYLAVCLTYLGYIDQGRSRMNEALSEARRLGHAYTLTHVLLQATWMESITRCPVLQQHVQEALKLSSEHGFDSHFAWATRYQGHSLNIQGRSDEGLALLKRALATCRASGVVPNAPRLLLYIAEAYAILGTAAEGLHILAEIEQIIEKTEERSDEAELYRMRGYLLASTGDRAAAEQNFQRAITVAERQSARLFQLRASVSLARVWRDQGKHAEARDLVNPIYNWFTEGFDAPDLKGAKALLDELA